MKKPLITFPKDIPVVNVVGSAVFSLIICFLIGRNLVPGAVLGAVILACFSNYIGSEFNKFMDEKYSNKFFNFVDDNPVASFFYGVAFITSIITICNLEKTSSFFIGGMSGIFFPIILGSVWGIKNVYKQWYKFLGEIDKYLFR